MSRESVYSDVLLQCFRKYQRIVIKVGSALLVDPTSLKFREQWFSHLLADLLLLYRAGHNVIIVSSGAIGLGRRHLHYGAAPLTLPQKQAASSIGQIDLMYHYKSHLAKENINTAQLLLTLQDTESRQRFLNARNTLLTLLHANVIPVINGNDAIATDEIRHGDNDRLSARVAQMVSADCLILLSDIDGLYNADPKINPSAEFIHEVTHIDAYIENMAGDAISGISTGGMRTKIQAAKIATMSGCQMLITRGDINSPLTHYAESERGTWFRTTPQQQSQKKAWLTSHLKSHGTVHIDQGAETALKKGKSLLAAGIKQVTGQFEKGDTIDVINAEHHVIARGLTNFSASEIKLIQGQSSHDYETILGNAASGEVIHCDNLAIITNTNQ